MHTILGLHPNPNSRRHDSQLH